MKREEAPVYIRHWIVTIIGVLTALMIWSRLNKPEYVESVPGQSMQQGGETRFVAVIYPKVSGHAATDSMSKSLFTEHMSELKNAGYSTVGLQQICDLYDCGKMLPEKAVIVLLDGHRETCLNAAPIIEELDLRATVMLNLGSMRRGSRSFMSWHDLRRLRDDPRWDFGLRVTGEGDLRDQLDYMEDHFADIVVSGISSPIDLGDSVGSLKDKIVFFPPGDGDGYNNSNTDPSGLSLLRIEPQQDADSLLGILSGMWSQAPRIENGFTEDAMRLNWVSTCGDTRVINGMLELSAEPSRSSADAWSAGTSEWSDVDISVKFKITGGKQFWAYVRFDNKDSFVRMGCDGERLYLQQKVAGARVKNLKVVEFDSGSSGFHNLRLLVRGPYAIAYLDGGKISARPFRIDDSLVSGKIGFAVWDSSCGVARCRITQTSIRKLPCIALMDMDWQEDLSGWIAEHSDHISYLCPGGLSADTSDVERRIDDYKALLISSAYNGHILAPTLVLDENDLKTNDSDALVGKLVCLIRDNNLEGINLDCRKFANRESSDELATILAALKIALPGTRLILSLSPKCYQSCEELAGLANVVVLDPEGRKSDFFDSVARPLRRKTLLLIETDKPWAVAGKIEPTENGRAIDVTKDNSIYVIQNYELKGVALCKRQTYQSARH